MNRLHVGFLILVLGAPSTSVLGAELKDASGVYLQGESLLIVGNLSDDVYFKVTQWTQNTPAGVYRQWPLAEMGLRLPARDLESVEEVGSTVVVLSEQSASLITRDRVVADYSRVAGELEDKLGLEGVAIRPLDASRSEVAVLWEGGFLRGIHDPFILVHTLDNVRSQPVVVTDQNAQKHKICSKQLNSDLRKLGLLFHSDGRPQEIAFRAPDLVWHKTKDGRWDLIVLLSVGGIESLAAEKWLARLQLVGSTYTPVDYHSLKNTLGDAAVWNWEGMSWLSEGDSLLLVADRYDELNLAVVAVPEEW